VLFPIQQLIEGRGEPLSVPKDTKLSDALALMVEHDYTQLPVVDENGKLLGVVSDDSIIRTYYHSSGTVSLLDLTVDHCQKRAVTLSPESDIFEALDELKNVYAIIIVKDQKPVGILTDYDTTHFFRDLSEGLILVEDIEVTLRQYIEAGFPTENAMQAALLRAFKHDKKDPTRPASEYEELSFGQHIQLITTDENWIKFNDVLGPKSLFVQLMTNVRDARNQLAHFRGRLDPVQYDALLRARDWLAARPKLPLPPGMKPKTVRITATDFLVKRGTGRYRPLEGWLVEQKVHAKNIRVGFEDIENVLGETLPPAAREHRSWWANDPISNQQSVAWLQAGWRVDDVDLTAGEVTFRQSNSALMQLFFADVLERLKEAGPGITQAKRTFPQSWWSFGAGKTGFSFSWSFTRGNELQVELYIDTGDKAENKAAFDRLYEQRNAIEEQIGVSLSWERLNTKQASRIAARRSETRITDSPDELEKAKQWAVETTLRFVHVFRPQIKEL
jgi:CBS domain-containing protein